MTEQRTTANHCTTVAGALSSRAVGVLAAVMWLASATAQAGTVTRTGTIDVDATIQLGANVADGPVNASATAFVQDTKQTLHSGSVSVALVRKGRLAKGTIAVPYSWVLHSGQSSVRVNLSASGPFQSGNGVNSSFVFVGVTIPLPHDGTTTHVKILARM
jgi:hypothetical protein